MIKFNNLSVINDTLKIDVYVEISPYYNNVFIDKIIIDTEKTYISTGPSNTPIYSTAIEGNHKSVVLHLTFADLQVDLGNTLFFAYVVTKGNPSADTPCGLDNMTSVQAAFDYHPLYLISMNYIKELNNICNIPKNFINFVLLFEALKTSVITKHYITSLDIWNRIHKDVITNTLNCKCNGTII